MKQHLVARGQRDRAMERGVAIDALAAGADVHRHLFESRLHRVEIALASPAGRELGQLDLQRLACLEHIWKPAPLVEQLGQRLPETPRAAQEDTLSVADVDETERLQHDERLPDRGAADLHALRELALGRELLAWHHAGLAYEVAEPFADILVKAAALERAKRCGGWRAHRAESSRRTGPVVQPLTTPQAWTTLRPSRLRFGTAGGPLMNANHGSTNGRADAWRLLAGSAAAVFAVAACGTSTTSSKLPTAPVTMGVLSCFTGTLASLGQAMLQGSQVAQKAINDGGGILGQQLVINHADTQCDEADSVPAVHQLLAASNVVGIIGPETQEINAVAPIVSSAKIPTQFQGGSTLFDQNANQYLWRDSPSDSQLGVAMALYAYNKGYRNAALVFYSDIAAQTFPPPIMNTFKKLGGTIATSITVAPDQTDYKTQVQQVIATKPDVIFTQTVAATSAVLFKNFIVLYNLAIPFVVTDVTGGDDYLKAITYQVAHDHLISVYGTSVTGAATDEFIKVFAAVAASV